MKKLLIALLLFVTAVVVVATRSGNQPEPQNMSAPTQVAADSPRPHSHEGYAMDDYAASGRVPAFYEVAPDRSALPPTLSPDMFTGNKRLAYQAAKEIPEVLAQLPCYCHCDRGYGHKSLHSCFESEHGENCGICIGEAIMAHNLQKRGVSGPQIRKQIIATYGRE